MARTTEPFEEILDAGIARARRPARSTRKRVSSATWVHATLLALFACAVIGLSSPVRDHLSSGIAEQMVWLNITAVTFCTFAAALCLTHWSSPPTRLLGFFLGAFTVYQFDTISNFVPDHHEYVVVSYLTWPAIVLCFVFWARATLTIVAATPTDDAPGRGLSASLLERWQRLQHLSEHFHTRSFPLLESVTVWMPATVFIALGFVPGLLFSYGTRQEAWHGWRFEPRFGFFVLAFWGFLVAVTCMALLFACWQRRAPHVLPGVDERARWAPRAALGLTFFLLFGLASALGIWPISIFDLFIACCAVPYALLAIDADSFRDVGATYSSFRQRVLAAALWCGLTLAIVAIVELNRDPIVRGLFAATVAAVLPVGLFLGRALVAAESPMIETPTRVEGGERIGQELSAPTTAPVALGLSLDGLERTLRMLREIDGDDLKTLIGGLSGPSGRKRNELRDPRADPRLRGFVRDFPALDSSRAWEVRLMRLNKLVYETARPRIGYDAGPAKDDPGRWRTLAAYCLLRLDPAEPLVGRFEREERLRLRVWLKGERAGLSFYDDLERMDEASLRSTFRDLAGEETAQRRKKTLDRALNATLRQVLEHWKARAEHALGERLRGADGAGLQIDHPGLQPVSDK